MRDDIDLPCAHMAELMEKDGREVQHGTKPFGGFLPDEDLVLVLDTNADYHGPWLVDADRLYEGVALVDGATGRSRGLVVAHLPD